VADLKLYFEILDDERRQQERRAQWDERSTTPSPVPGDSPTNPQYVNSSDSDDSEAKTVCSDSSRTLGSQDTWSTASQSPSESSYSPSETSGSESTTGSESSASSPHERYPRLPYSSSPETSLSTSDDDSTPSDTIPMLCEELANLTIDERWNPVDPLGPLRRTRTRRIRRL